MGRIGVTFSGILLALLVLLPFGTMVVESLSVGEVRLKNGSVYHGPITDQDDEWVRIRPRTTGRTEEFRTSEVEFAGRVFALDNYEGLLSGRAERNMLLGTLALAGVSTLLAILIGLPLGLLFGVCRMPRAVEVLLVLPLILPPILTAIGTYHDLADFKPAFLRAAIVFGLTLYPLVMLFTARAVRGIGADALDAARLHATPREALLRVALRPALPGAAAGALLVFVFVIADFAVPDFLGVTTAKNTIVVYANAVFRAWRTDIDAGRATAIGMPVTLLALLGFALVLWIEKRRGAATVGSDFNPPNPLPLRGGARVGAWLLIAFVLLAAVVWPARGHAKTAAGDFFGDPVALAGAAPMFKPSDPRAKPDGLMDGMRRGVRHPRVKESTFTSLGLAAGGALIAVLIALLATEAGRGRPRFDKFFLLVCFLPVAVPPMSLAVGWVTLYGTDWAQMRWTPALLLAARLLPFATFAVRSVRARIDDELLDAAAVAGLPPWRRFVRITIPMVRPGIALGLLLAFLFGLREVDALVFTRMGGETLPVQLYNMIHYGFDVQVGALAILWMCGVGLFLVALLLLAGTRFRLLP
ncbi:MAG: ABC transporter permease [Planctomycetota bacterium]|jgi:iron(III) transport system permease protein